MFRFLTTRAPGNSLKDTPLKRPSLTTLLSPSKHPFVLMPVMTTCAVAHLCVYFFTACLHFHYSVSSIRARTVSVLLKIKLAQRKTCVRVHACARACMRECVRALSSVQLFANPWTVQAPLSTEFSRQEYWSGLSSPTPRVSPTQGSNPHILHLLH